MNKKALSAILFLIIFVAVYLFICFGIPGMRIKLEAEPVELFFASITHMTLSQIINLPNRSYCDWSKSSVIPENADVDEVEFHN